ncbi:hypothetical protein CDD80_2174 [Ophiocordyceps camponoti-rufipedis]|uniref:Uncharacterized protein n=1 Tax=Ophiocordyceps camponoti-rufipedis TaxID=2004952 RepID=A0A2C5Z1K4_9HYPO|nr:hypothetical protein CDD80_2174 [Ophiocordyceps camponoti-rufipedis]
MCHITVRERQTAIFVDSESTTDHDGLFSASDHHRGLAPEGSLRICTSKTIIANHTLTTCRAHVRVSYNVSKCNRGLGFDADDKMDLMSLQLGSEPPSAVQLEARADLDL